MILFSSGKKNFIIAVLLVCIFSLSIYFLVQLTQSERNDRTRASFNATTIQQPENNPPVNVNQNIQTNVIVQPDIYNNTISPLIWGINNPGLSIVEEYTPYLTKEDVYRDFDEQMIKQMGIKMIRFPGGHSGDFFNWKTNNLHYKFNFQKPPAQEYNFQTMSIDKALDFANSLQAELLYEFNINIPTQTYPTIQEDQIGALSLNPGSYQDITDIVTKYKGKIKYYEIGSEQNYYWPAQRYREVAQEISKRVKSIDPSAKIIALGIQTWQEGPRASEWKTLLPEMKRWDCGSVKCIDYFQEHEYPPHNKEIINGMPIKIAGNFSYIYDNYRRLQESWYGPQKIAITEYNLEGYCSIGSPLGTIQQGLSNASQILNFAYMDVDIAAIWKMGLMKYAGSKPYFCSTFTNKNTLAAPGQIFALTSVLAGGRMLETTISTDIYKRADRRFCTDYDCITPIVYSYAAVGPNIPGYSENLYIYFINLSPSSTSKTRVSLAELGFQFAGMIDSKTLSATNIEQRNFTETLSQLPPPVNNLINISLPPLSVTRLKLDIASTTKTPSAINQTIPYAGYDVMPYMDGPNQKIKLSYVSKTGSYMIQQDCHFNPNANFATGEGGGYNCQSSKKIPLDQKYSGYASFAYMSKGITKIRQTFITKYNGFKVRSRNCILNTSTGEESGCSHFEEFSTGIFRNALDNNFMVQKSGVNTFVRQTYLEADGESAYFRDCTFNPVAETMTGCSPFTKYPIGQIGTPFPQSGTSVFLFNSNTGLKIRKSYLNNDGFTISFRTCNFDIRTMTESNCTKYFTSNIKNIQ